MNYRSYYLSKMHLVEQENGSVVFYAAFFFQIHNMIYSLKTIEKEHQLPIETPVFFAFLHKFFYSGIYKYR